MTVAGYPSSVRPQLLQVTNMRLDDGQEVLIWGTEPRWGDDYLGGPSHWSGNLDRVEAPATGRAESFPDLEPRRHRDLHSS